MKKQFGSVLFVAVVALCVLFVGNAKASVNLDIEKSTVNELHFSLLNTDTDFESVESEFGVFLRPIINDAEHTYSKSGAPDFLYYNALFAVPGDNRFEVVSVSSEYTPLEFPIYPVMKSEIDGNGSIKKEFAYMPAEYSNVLSPKECDVKYYGIAGNVPLAKARIALLKYENNKFMVLSKISVSIKFTPTVGAHNGKFEVIPQIINSNVASDFALVRNIPFSREKKQNEAILSENSQYQVKIKIPEEGVYRITPSMLSGIGVSIPAADVKSIKVIGGAGYPLNEKPDSAEISGPCEQPIIVKTTQSGELESITFYANGAKGYFSDSAITRYNNWYGNNVYFYLRWGGADGARAVATENPSGTVVNSPTTYIERYYFEENLVNPYQTGSGRVFLGRSIMPAIFTTQLYNLDRNGIIKYRLGFAQSASDTGYFDIYESSSKIVENSILGANEIYSSGHYNDLEVSLPANKIPTDNRSVLKFDYKPNKVASSSGYFRYYEIHYPRVLMPLDNSISFFSDFKSGLTEYSINGFSGSEIIGWDATNRLAPVLLTNASVTGGMFIFRKDCTGKAQSHFFISGRIIQPEIEKIDFVDLRKDLTGADAVVVTSPELLQSAESYKAYRELNNKIKIRIVTTKDIFNEFGSGTTDPAAIRNFLRFAYLNWQIQPKTLVIWGDGHYDYKNIQTNAYNHVPAWQTLEAKSTYWQPSSICTDDFYALLVGNDTLVDISFGRVPIQSNSAGESYLQKIKDYEHKSSLDMWRTMATLVADDGPTDNSSGSNGADHTNQSERLAKIACFSDFQKKKIYMGAYPVENTALGRRKPKVTQDIVNTTNVQGELFLNWVGHGSPRIWAHELVFERETTIPQLVNYDKLSVMFSASCDNGRFDMPEISSLAEDLVLSKVGGSIASIAATRMVTSTGNERFQNELYTQLLTRNEKNGLYPDLGTALKITKVLNYDENSQKHVLLGDPLVKMLIPDYRITVDSINGVDIVNQDSIVPLKGLAKVRISGQIRLPNNSAVDEGFDGVITLNMFDADENVIATEYDGSVHNFSRNGSALARASFKVSGGHYSAEFLLPKDIAYSNKTGRLFLYSFSSDSTRFAMGMNTSYSVIGLDLSAVNPGSGPEMKIYLDSRAFANRDIVSKNPMLIVDLRDDDGINATGVGVGHRIQAWIDNNPIPIDMTDKYRNSIYDLKAGSIESVLNGLAIGYHTVQVRAWDVFNNPSVGNAEFFIVTDTKEIDAYGIDNYPNPFDYTTTFRFKHNVTPPFEATIKIYNLTGSLVRTIRADLSDLHNSEVPFDGLDDSGRQLAIGYYTYLLTLTSSSGIDGTQTGSFVVNR